MEENEIINKTLADLFEWILDSISIRENLKKLIENQEKQDNIWLDKVLAEIAGKK